MIWRALNLANWLSVYNIIIVTVYTSSKNSALLIIRQPLPKIVSNLVIRQRSSRVYAMYIGIECVRGWTVEY